MVRYIYIFLFGAVFCFSFLGSSAQAQRLEDMSAKPLPEVMLLPQEDFEKATISYEETPYGDETLAYQVRLPKDWIKVSSEGDADNMVNTNILGDIALYYSGPRIDAKRSQFSLSAETLKYEMDIEQWFLQYMFEYGFALEGVEVFDKQERKIEALHVYIKGGETFVVRTVAQINGKRVVLARYTVPANYWEKEKDISAQVMKSFKLQHIKVEVIEELQDHMFLDLVSMKYPASWKLQAKPVKDIDRMYATLQNIRPGTRILDGQMYIDIASINVMKDLNDEIESLKIRINSQGLTLGELIEEFNDYSFEGNVEFGFVDVYDAQETDEGLLDYEVWIAGMASGDYFFFVHMVTPNRKDDYFTWSKNVAAFKLILRFIDPTKKENAGYDEDMPVQLE